MPGCKLAGPDRGEKTLNARASIRMREEERRM